MMKFKILTSKLAILPGLLMISLVGCSTAQESTLPSESISTSTPEATQTAETIELETTPEFQITPTIAAEDSPGQVDLYEGLDPANLQITLWHSLQGSQETALLGIAERFNSTNEWGISIVPENQGSPQDLHERMLAFMNTEKAPNLVMTFGSPAGTYQLGEVLIDITPLINHETWGLPPNDQASIFTGFYEQGIFPSFGGERLSFPLFGTMNVLYYNSDWLTELGYSGPPETPEIFRQAACAAVGQPFSAATASSRSGYRVIVDPSIFTDWIFAFGGKLFDYGNNQYAFDYSANVSAMTFLKDLVNAGCALPAESQPTSMEEFSQGTQLFSIDSIENIPIYRSNVQAEANFNWRIAPIPHTTNAPTANVRANNASILKTSAEEQLAAWLFLRYFVEAEVQAGWVEATGTLPIRTDTAAHLQDYLMTSPAYQMAYEILGHGVYEPPVPGYHEVRDQYQDAFRSIIESADVQDALGQLSTEANLFLNEQMALIPESPDPWGEIDPSGQTITLWHQHPEDRRAAFEKIINEFNITNKWGITVIPENQESYGDIFLNLLPVIGTEGAPDLVLAYQHHAAAYHLANALIDLNSLVESTTWGINSLEREDFFPGIYSQDIFPIFEGARLGYPVQRSMDVLYYNADWLADLGFDSPPATPEEFIQMACAAAAPNQPDKENTLGYQIYVDATRFSSWVFAFGGEIFDEGANSFNYDNPLTAEVVNYFLDLINTGCAAAVFERQEAHTAFTDEVSLFLVDSSIHIPTIDSQIKENADFDWAIAPMPSSQEDPIQHVFGASLSILPSNPEKELAAWLFLKHFTSPEIQAEWGKTSNFLPVRISSAEHLEDYFSDHPQYHKAFELLTFGITEPSLPGYDFVGQEVDIALETILQGADVNEVLTSLNQIANQLLTMHLER